MLTRAELAASVPREPRANMEARLRLMDAADGDPAVRAELMALCAESVEFWIDLFCVQVNPRQVGSEFGPFILFDFQRNALRQTMAWLADQEDVLWEKSRYLGATWLALLMQVHECLFKKFKKFLDISHTASAVDSTHDPDSLFWKVQFVLDHLPDWMTRGAEKRKVGVVQFPETRSSMTGAATTERAGVGGRATWVLLDEFAKQKDDFSILGQTADTGPRHFVSTHYGTGTAWFSLTQRPDIKRVVMHWSQHPHMNAGLYRSNGDGTCTVIDTSYQFPAGYQFIGDGTPHGGPFNGIRSPWYDRECQRRANARDIAMHLDIDPKGSVAQYFPSPLIHRLRQSTRLWVWEGDLAHDIETGLPIALVPRIGGPLRLWLNPMVDGRMPPAQYVIGGDVANGTGSTPSCLTIGRSDTGVKLGEYVNAYISPEPMGSLAVALARFFNDGEVPALLIWERQGPGELFTKRVLELGFRHIWFKRSDKGVVEVTSEEPGFYPTLPAKKLAFDRYIAALSDGSCTNPSDRALEQSLDFRYDLQGYPEHPKQKQSKDDPSAGGVNHGDIVMADVLWWTAAREQLVKRIAVEKEEVKVGSFQWRRELRIQQLRQEQWL